MLSIYGSCYFVLVVPLVVVVAVVCCSISIAVIPLSIDLSIF